MFGSHLSIAGGMHNALLEAESLQMQTVQVFTKNQQQWKCAPLAAEAVELWSSHRKRLKFKQTVSHASYLINLASPDETLWRASIDLFVVELTRCAALGIPYLVIHPGAHMGTGEKAGLARVAAALNLAMEKVGEMKAVADAKGGDDPKAGDRAMTIGDAKASGYAKVIACLEITAGQGSSLGYRLEHLASIIDAVKSPGRVGVCLDTAHLFAAGYDFRGRKYSKFRKELDSRIGIKPVKVLHLNDSKKELGSRVDRHDHIGLGKIGVTGFTPFVRDEAFLKIPKILETPKGKQENGAEWDEANLRLLQGLMK